MNQKTDNQSLINGLAQHDRIIVRHMMQTMQPIVINVLLQKNAPKALAEDIYMDALEAIYREIEGKGAAALIQKLSKPRPTQLQTYLIQICLNLFYKSLRRNKVKTGVTSADEMVYKEDESITSYMHQVEQRRLFDQKLSRLDASCQALLALFFQKISMKEIAEKLNISEKYAKKKKFNCKSKLVELIQTDALYQELKY